jgi:hypothetical protein
VETLSAIQQPHPIAIETLHIFTNSAIGLFSAEPMALAAGNCARRSSENRVQTLIGLLRSERDSMCD